MNFSSFNRWIAQPLVLFALLFLFSSPLHAIPNVGAHVQWFDLKGSIVDLQWRTATQWVWTGGPGNEVPALYVWIEYPSHFGWNISEEPGVSILEVGATNPLGNEPGKRVLKIRMQSPLYSKKLERRTAQGEIETGGLTISLKYGEPALLIHPSCQSLNLSLIPLQSVTEIFFYLSARCELAKAKVNIFLTTSEDVSWRPVDSNPFLKQSKTGPYFEFPIISQSIAPEVELLLSTVTGDHRGNFLLSMDPVKRNNVATKALNEDSSSSASLTLQKSGPSLLSVQLTPALFNFAPPGKGPTRSEMNLITGLSLTGFNPTKKWQLEGQVFITPLSLLNNSLGLGRVGVYGGVARALHHVTLDSLGTTLFVGPGLIFSDILLAENDDNPSAMLGPQLLLGMTGQFRLVRNSQFRTWVEFAMRGTGLNAPSLSNRELALGWSHSLLVNSRQWNVILKIANSAVPLGEAPKQAHLTIFSFGLQTEL